jgi:cytochrome P450
MSLVFDPTTQTAAVDPYPMYRRLRDEAPVHFSPEADVWCVSRHDDVVHVLKTPEIFSSRAMFTVLMNGGHEGPPPLTLSIARSMLKMAIRGRMNPFGFASSRMLIAEDGASHTAMRNVVNRGFTPRQITAWEARARELVNTCTAPLRRGASFDVVRDLAVPLPVTLISEMLGIPAERREEFKTWCDRIIHALTGKARDPFGPLLFDTIIELIRVLKPVIRARRREPRDDLVSLLVQEQDGEVGLDDREVIQFALLLLIAGNETTTNLIGNAVQALLDHPEQLEALQADPSLVPGALEETLRYDAPIQVVFRVTTEATQIAGTTIPKGAIVAPLLGSANRDERRFEAADCFDVTRRAQGHVGFGFGKHFCLGASLARLEATAALEAVLPHLSGMAREDAQPPLIDSFLVRGRESLALKPAA